MDVTGNAAGDVAVTHAVGENDSGDIVAARKDRGEIAATIRSGRIGDNVGFKPGELQGAMGPFISSPELHAAKGASDRGGALKILRFDLFEFHKGMLSRCDRSTVSTHKIRYAGIIEVIRKMRRRFVPARSLGTLPSRVHINGASCVVEVIWGRACGRG